MIKPDNMSYPTAIMFLIGVMSICVGIGVVCINGFVNLSDGTVYVVFLSFIYGVGNIVVAMAGYQIDKIGL